MWFISVVYSQVIPQYSFTVSDSIVPNNYSFVDGIFHDDGDTSTFDITAGVDSFGLKDHLTWNDVITKLHRLNTKGDGIYKLFFFARHGEGFHNIIHEHYGQDAWKCHYQMLNGATINDTYIEWRDARLTTKGINQIKNLSLLWTYQLQHLNTPLPKSFYVSPLTRTLQTFDKTWSNHVNYSQVKPVVKEFARETYGISSCSYRQSKEYIKRNWPFAVFEANFTENDHLWNVDQHESKASRELRANLLLNDIFTNDWNDIISLTSHSGTISSILKLIGRKSSKLNTGSMVAVIIKATDYHPFKKPFIKVPFETLPSYCDKYNST